MPPRVPRKDNACAMRMPSEVVTDCVSQRVRVQLGMRRTLISATPHAAVRLCPRASACMLGQCASSRVPAPDVATDGRSHARRRLLHQAQRACRCGRAWRAGGERRRPHPMAPCDVRRGWSSRLQRGCSACRGRRASKLDAPAPRPRRGPLLRQSRELVRVPVRVPAPTTEESHVYCFRADPHTFRIFAFSYMWIHTSFCEFTPHSQLRKSYCACVSTRLGKRVYNI